MVSGLAMYTVEYVPTTMPTSIAAAKSQISPTPKMSRPTSESAVTPEVRMVRDRVSLTAMLMISAQRLALVLGHVLADAVVDHDGVVDRVADDGEQRRDGGEVELARG